MQHRCKPDHDHAVGAVAGIRQDADGEAIGEVGIGGGEGLAIVFISAELDEVLHTSHRIVVLRDRRKVAELPAAFVDELTIFYDAESSYQEWKQKQADAIKARAAKLPAGKKRTGLEERAEELEQEADNLFAQAEALEEEAIEARAELLADELGREAIGVTQTALWEQAKAQGLLEEERHLQEWVSRHDDVVCPICDELDGQRVEIGEPFESPTTGEQYDDAHAHPRCRCKKRIVTVRTPDRQTRRRAA